MGSGTVLKKALSKYGVDNFSKEILYIANNETEALTKERELIKSYNAALSEEFYNIHEGGSGGNTMLGWDSNKRKEFSEKMSKISSGSKNGMYGKKHSISTIKAISHHAKHTRDNSIYRTDEYRKLMSSITSAEKNGMFNKKHSEESKQKMSENSVGLTAGERNGMYGKSGENAINGVKIEMLNDEKEIIKTFVSVREVLSFLGIKGHTALGRALKNNTKYKNYYWRRRE